MNYAQTIHALASGQAAWDNAAPPEPDIEGELRDSFAAGMRPDALLDPAVWAYGCTWLKRSQALNADVLGDSIRDDGDLLRRAMVTLAEAAAGQDVQCDARALVAEAGARWARSNS